jgi:hypothetical protein
LHNTSYHEVYKKSSVYKENLKFWNAIFGKYKYGAYYFIIVFLHLGIKNAKKHAHYERVSFWEF